MDGHRVLAPTESRLQVASPLPPPLTRAERATVGLVNRDVGKSPVVIILGLILLLIGIIVGIPIPEAPGHLSRGSRAPLCGNLGTSRGTTKWDGGSIFFLNLN